MRMMEQTGERPDVALDRLDNPDHRSGYRGSALPTNYQPKPRERTIRVILDYEFSPDGDMKIIQKK